MADPYADIASPADDYSGFSSPVAAGSKAPVAKNYGAGHPILNYMAAQNNKRDVAQYESDQRKAANKDAPPSIVQPVKDFSTPATNALAAIKTEAKSQIGKPMPTSPGQWAGAIIDQTKSDFRQAGNVLSLALSPITGAINEATGPVSRAAERAGVGEAQVNQNVLNTSLAGARGGVPKPNALTSIVEGFDRAGVTPNLAAAKGKGAATFANVVAENPVAGIRARAALKTQATEAGQSASRLAGSYGNASGSQIAGETVQSGVQRFANSKKVAGDASAPAGNTSFAAKSGALYDDAFSTIDAAQAAKTGQQADLRGAGGDVGSRPYSTVTASQTEATLGALTSRAGGQIGDLISDPKLSSIAEAVVKDRGVTNFGDLRALRTWVRTARKDPNLRQGVDSAALGSLERALSADIATNAEALAGPQAAAKLRRADQFYAAGSARIENALQPFADAQSGEGAYQRVIQAAGSTGSADAQKLVSLKRSLSADEWGDVAATTLDNLGKPTASVAGAEPGGFSVGTFLTNYNKLSPRGREILFGSVGGGGAKASNLKAELDNLASVVDRLKSVQKGANTSNSAVNAQGMMTLGAGGLSLPVTIKVLGSMAGAGEILTNPAFVRWLARSPSNPAAMGAHLTKLDALAATYPALNAYRQRLAEDLRNNHQGDVQPIGNQVPAPQIPAPAAP